MRQRSISQTFSLPLDLVERIAAVCEQLRIKRSFMARRAIEKELRRYEQNHDREKLDGGPRVRRRTVRGQGRNRATSALLVAGNRLAR